MTDTLKLLLVYGNATVVILGGGWMLYVSRAESDATDFRLVVAGFIGAAISFLFGQESATRSARATERALLTPAPERDYMGRPIVGIGPNDG